jgi:hypothetical protein
MAPEVEEDILDVINETHDLNPLHFYLQVYLKPFAHSSPVDDVKMIGNRILAGFQTIRNMPGFWQSLLVAMRRRADAST